MTDPRHGGFDQPPAVVPQAGPQEPAASTGRQQQPEPPEAGARAAAATGLREAEVAERVARGLVNDTPDAPSRTVAEILKANLLTPFNFLLGGLLVVILIVGPFQDALFGIVLVTNSLIGIVQELRAKRTLDRLEVLSAPKARVVREARVREVRPGDVVLDDVLELRPGDQVVADGSVLETRGLEVDESLLTGESDPVTKRPGDAVLSGSYAAAGSGRYRATRVGRNAYAASLAEEARRFRLVHSELRSGIDRVVRLVGWAILPTAALLLYSQLAAHEQVGAALQATVGGVVAMVPEGLVLLTSVAFAAGVVRLARRGALMRELPAVETLARVDVVCMDKTGTITHGEVTVVSLELLGGRGNEEAALGALAAADPNPNATLVAIGERFPRPPDWVATGAVPFSPARKWSGSTFGERGTWLLGAPEVLLAEAGVGIAGELRRTVDRYAEAGRRVVLLARAASPLAAERLPRDLEPRAIVLLEDRVREDAPETLRFFAAQGVRIKVVSGDHPRTVAAVAGRAGVPGADRAVDAAALPSDPEGLADAVESHSIFGRVTPHQKRDMVAALKQRGHVVAMTGDGVNDVLALKQADIGVAMGSGSSASRAVAQLVLLDGSFANLPAAVAEGRRVINNIERVAKLFLTKTVYSMLLALSIGVVGLPFPFLPRHLTLIGSLTIGIPSFFLALPPNDQPARSGFVARALRFAGPAGVLAAGATFAGYYLAVEGDVSVAEAQTTATLVLASVGLLLLTRLARPLTPRRRGLLAAMWVILGMTLVLPPVSAFFDLDLPPLLVALAILGIVVIAYRLILLAEMVAGRLARRQAAS